VPPYCSALVTPIHDLEQLKELGGWKHWVSSSIGITWNLQKNLQNIIALREGLDSQKIPGHSSFRCLPGASVRQQV
jgi:hypothetical protein